MMKKIDYPQRIALANIPTPLQKMERLSEKLGVEIWFKRDDLTGSELSGNKIRKLEFLLSEAVREGYDTVITCGGKQSNHCRATALAATRVGLKSVLILRTDDPSNPPRTDGNILLDKLAGAELVWITPEEYQRRDAIFKREEERLLGLGKKPYVIPEGGSNALGAWGYIRCMEELTAQVDDPEKPATIMTATGSGGTLTGLLLGKDLFCPHFRITGVNVCDDADYFRNIVMGICNDFSGRFGGISIPMREEIEIVDGYVGRGYALSRAGELEAIRDLALLEGVVLDPVYTGKAYFGMISELKNDPSAFGDRIIFMHTGGLFGLFPIADQISEILM